MNLFISRLSSTTKMRGLFPTAADSDDDDDDVNESESIGLLIALRFASVGSSAAYVSCCRSSHTAKSDSSLLNGVRAVSSCDPAVADRGEGISTTNLAPPSSESVQKTVPP